MSANTSQLFLFNVQSFENDTLTINETSTQWSGQDNVGEENNSSDYQPFEYDGRESGSFGYQKDILPLKVYTGVSNSVYALGFLGNALIFFLMFHPWFRTTSYSVYLRFLAVMDSLVLAMSMADELIDIFTTLDAVMIFDLTLCRFWQWLTAIVRMSSVWLLVAMSFDRFMAVAFPIHYRRVSSIKTSTVICVGVIIISGAISIFNAVVYSFIDMDGELTCWMADMSHFFAISVLDLVLQSLVPALILLLVNVNIIIIIQRSRRFRDSATKSATAETQSSASGQASTPKVDRATISLVYTAFMAFITLTPEALYSIFEATGYIEEIVSSTEAAGEVYIDPWNLLHVITLLNFAQNAYILFLTGARFRQAFASYFVTSEPNSNLRGHRK